jgi:hypothetical protein
VSPSFKTLAKLVTLTPRTTSFFDLETHHFKAKLFYWALGKFANILFCESGILRSFNINDNIVEHILTFRLRRLWIRHVQLNFVPGNLFIEVLEDAEIAMLSKENQEFLYAEILNSNAFQNPDWFLGQTRTPYGQSKLQAEKIRFEKISSKIPHVHSKNVSKNKLFLILVWQSEFFSKMKSRLLRK